VRQLLPDTRDDFDVRLLTARSNRTPPPDRPWTMANMVMSADGAHAVDGRSAGLAGPADKLVFHTLRASADAVLVAAGTARQERYGRPARRVDLRLPGEANSDSPAPRLVVLTRSLFIPDDQPFLGGDGVDPLVLHPMGAGPRAVPSGVELRGVPHGEDGGVDLAEAMRILREEGMQQVLCEGGPTLLGSLHRQGLLDELFVTISPRLVGGDELGLLGPVPAKPAEMRIHRLLEADGFLFVTYR
jgi:riboflavin biosynthesis pyrimidine reductase